LANPDHTIFSRPNCTENLKNIFSTDSGFICYFLDDERIRVTKINPNVFFLATANNNNAIIQNICDNTTYSIDSLIILKFGSIEKYIELALEEEKDQLLWLKFPKTIEAACNVIRGNYNQYLNCYPEDTITPANMLINEVATVSQINLEQKHLLSQRIFFAIHAFSMLNNVELKFDMEYYAANQLNFYDVHSLVLPIKDMQGIFIGNLNFCHIIQSVLTKEQMDMYLTYYNNQQKIREYASTMLFHTTTTEEIILFKELCPDCNTRDFLCKEVFKKPE
jgi:hypothetical protein